MQALPLFLGLIFGPVRPLVLSGRYRLCKGFWAYQMALCIDATLPCPGTSVEPSGWWVPGSYTQSQSCLDQYGLCFPFPQSIVVLFFHDGDKQIHSVFFLLPHNLYFQQLILRLTCVVFSQLLYQSHQFIRSSDSAPELGLHVRIDVSEDQLEHCSLQNSRLTSEKGQNI